MIAKDAGEVVDMFFPHVFNAEIVDAEGEQNRAKFMVPKSRCDGALVMLRPFWTPPTWCKLFVYILKTEDAISLLPICIMFYHYLQFSLFFTHPFWPPEAF